jgi:hypothetical protein
MNREQAIKMNKQDEVKILELTTVIEAKQAYTQELLLERRRAKKRIDIRAYRYIN